MARIEPVASNTASKPEALIAANSCAFGFAEAEGAEAQGAGGLDLVGRGIDDGDIGAGDLCEVGDAEADGARADDQTRAGRT